MSSYRLKSLVLTDFRCFSEAEVDLRSDVTVIYGRNGSGKTSLFDALDFALFGSIGRLEDYANGGSAHVPRVGSEQPARVKLSLANSSDSPWVETWTDGRGESGLASSGNWSNHRELLYGLLVDSDRLSGPKKVTDLRELFRATVLLSQDSIRKFVEDRPEERAKVLARLAGRAHTQRRRDKVDRVVAYGQKEGRRIARELREAEGALSDLASRTGEMEGRRASLVAELSGETPTEEAFLHAAQAIGAEVRPRFDSDEDRANSLGLLRGHASELLIKVEHESRLLASVEVGLESHGHRSRRLQAAEAEVEQLRQNLAGLGRELKELESEETVAREAQAATRTQASESATALAQVSAAHEAIHQAIRLRAESGSAARALEAGRRVSSELSQQAEKTTASRSELTADLTSRRSTVNRLQIELGQLEGLRERLRRHEASVGELSRKRAEITDVATKLDQARSSITEQLAHVESLADGVAKAQITFDETARLSGEREQLGTRLRTLTEGDTCPLCGTPHASHEALLVAIDRALANVPAATRAAADALESQREAHSRAADTLAQSQAEADRLGSRLERLGAEIATADAEHASLRTDADQLGAEATGSSIADAIARTRNALKQHTDAHAQLEARVQSLDEISAELQRKIASADTAIRAQTQRCEDVGADLDEVTNRLAGLGYAPDHWPSEDTLTRRKQEAEVKAAQLAQDERDAAASLRSIRDRLGNLRGRHAETRDRLSSLEIQCQEDSSAGQVFRDRCQAAGFSDVPPLVDLQDARRALEGRASRAREASELADRMHTHFKLERLDEEKAKASAERVEAAERVRLLEQQQERTKRATEEAESWRLPLDTELSTAVVRTVRTHQLEVERHFKAMIPAPHRFDRISLAHGDAGLQLGVQFRGEAVEAGEPPLYLSSAQLNVLALAIFLSLGARQQWANLNCLLLDDPVQHLDDLDAVAFLDTLRAVALGRFGTRRQIVLSTCDRRLFQLMVQKFAAVKEYASFTAIVLSDAGSGGPRVHYHVGGPTLSTSRAG